MASFTQLHSFSPSCGVRAAAGTSYRSAAAAPTAVDYGRILGVGPNASKGEVKTAYRKLALQFHPDVCKGEECDVNFMEVNRAYESLMALQSRQGNGYSSYVGESSASYTGFGAAGEPASGTGAQDDDPWAEFLQSLVNGTHEEPREDYSCYYSNLKCYGSKARRNRSAYTSGSSQYYQGHW